MQKQPKFPRFVAGFLLLVLPALGVVLFDLPTGRSPEVLADLGIAQATATEVSSPWLVSLDDKSGLPAASKGGASALSTSFVFWGGNWAWAGMQSQFRVTAPFEYILRGRNTALDFDMAADIQRAGEHELEWEFVLDARSTKTNVIGGGIVFRFGLSNFGAEMGEPVILPDNRGWTWGREGGSHMEMRFEPALASVYFERGNKNELRAFFYEGTVPQGKQRFTARLTVSSDMEIAPTTGERFGLADPADWPQDNLDWQRAPVDLSFLNASEKPAGRRGFIKAADDRLVFEDGTPARFWGTNLTASALFGTSKMDVRQQAKRLSALGFNLVRLHHHDSDWVNPNIFGDKRGIQDTQTLSAVSLDRLDWWIKCLKDEGIYVWLDLHVGRAFRSADGIWGFDEMRKGKEVAEAKGFNYVNLTLQQAMKLFNEAYVSHVNRYTGTAYKDEPAIAAMLITNENDITHHFGNGLLPDKNVPKHNRLYMAEAEAFARAHDLSIDKTWQSWKHGPSKIFLNDLEHRFDVDMIAQLRELGVKVPIATTNTWGDNPLSSLPALTSGDLIDVHAYGGVGQLEKNPMLAPTLTDWMAAGQVAGKPMSVTEWNAEPFPTPDRHAMSLYVASTASLQGWDAMMQYAYSQRPINGPGRPSNWHAYNDPALLATLPAAALLYRRGDVREADTTYAFTPSREQLFFQPISAGNSPALRTAAEIGKLVIVLPKTKELPWLIPGVIPKGARIFSDPTAPLIESKPTEAISDTGELRRQWDKGIYTIDTPRTQAAMGWIGGEKIVLRDIRVVATTHNATVAVQSLDGGAPIGQSKDLLISLGARAVPKAGNRTPFNVEPVEGELTIRAPKGLRLFRRGVMQELKEVPVVYSDGRYVIGLDKTLRTNWLFLRERGA